MLFALQVQNADSHPHPHQREAAPLSHLQQELFTSGEPEDSYPLPHRWSTLKSKRTEYEIRKTIQISIIWYFKSIGFLAFMHTCTVKIMFLSIESSLNFNGKDVYKI